MASTSCRPITHFPKQIAQSLRFFFTDIDDTITSDGLLTADAYSALWSLHTAGIQVIPITGRPAGWCDHFTRMWPVAGVVGENGAFYFAYDRISRTMKRHFFQSIADREHGITLLKRMRERVLNEIPGCGISADQDFRYADLAIDFCEDVDPLPREEIQKICSIAEELSLTYKVSSIHVNCWYGDFDKLSCMKRFIQDYTGQSLNQLSDKIVFTGDSPNDEPMFAGVPHSIAVANINRFLPELTHLPGFVTSQESGKGFVEAVKHILLLRS